MKRFLTLTTAISALFFLASCNDSNQQAQEKLAEARLAFESSQFDKAKQLIDSIKILYPKAFETRHESLKLQQDVDLKQNQVAVDSLNEVIASLQEKIDAAASKLTFEKDAEYQQTGNYMASSQVVEKNLHRSFLRFQTDEAGNLSMTSIYCGASSIHHTAVKVSAPNGSSAQTPPSRDSYETTDMGEHIEKADYKYAEDGGVIDFICTNKDKELKVTFIGDRSNNTVMKATDKQAAVSILQLAELLKAREEASKVREEAQLRIRFVEKKISERSVDTNAKS